ncbi:transposase mutator family protein, partial [Rhodococcus wratislaviensis IFP 2016]
MLKGVSDYGLIRGVLTEIRNRGVADVYIAVCDGLEELAEAITTVWPPT